ncbi:ATP-binding cassette domain-containing protein [candidate division GN15 bacterium]|nr:ATP-binding cassette domain-containing protein [candidate division GN15 bacterium]
MISLTNVTKTFSTTGPPAVDNFSLSVPEGQLLVLLGESGSGKTTTLKMINRLIEPTRGSIEIDGENALLADPVALRRRIGYVFQGIGLFPHLTIAENVGAVPRLLGWPREDINSRVDELLSLVGLDPVAFADRFPSELSGGQQQRIGVARALAARPRLMLMDEPFGALDPLTRDELQPEFTRLHRELGLTVVLVTHDMTEALLLADRIAVMKDGELIATGTPSEMLQRPANDYVAALMATPKRQADQLEAIAGSESSPTDSEDGS